ncbi:MAG: S8 family serine peptidase [Bdellovibrio sp.]|nr:S8 family serine peptidase [Bdellovibrio sp.]
MYFHRYKTIFCVLALFIQTFPSAVLAELTEVERCFNDDSLNPLNTASFGNLKSVFNCDVLERNNFRERRPYLNDAINGKQTAYWAQEMVGADLANEYMQRLKARDSNAIGVTDVPVGIVDTGFALTTLRRDRFVGNALACRQAVRTCNPDAADFVLQGHTIEEVGTIMENTPYRVCSHMNNNCPPDISANPGHGTQVGNLIIGDPPMSSTSEARVSMVDTFRENSEGSGNASAAILDTFHAATPRPRIVNLSMQCHLEVRSICKDWPPTYQSLAQETVVVKSSGNHYPEEVDPITKTINGIVVGSLSPSGLASEFSQEGPEVTISAPSDLSILSRGTAGDDERKGSHYTRFSGTSGSAPMVTSALTNVMALLPNITTAELKILLKKTAVPTAGTIGGLNGAGSLNALKLVEVAHRLKAANWPSAEARAKLNTTELYDYSEQAQRLLDKANKLMAEIPYNENICNRHKDAFKLIRQAFFLAPRNPHIRKALGDIYRANGYEAQASFADPSAGKRAIALQARTKAGKILALIRSGTFSDSDEPLLREYLESIPDDTSSQDYFSDRVLKSMYALLPKSKHSVERVLMGLNTAHASTVLDGLARSSNQDMDKGKAAEFYKAFIKSPNMTDKKFVYYFVEKSGLEEAVAKPLFQIGLNSSTKNDRLAALLYLNDTLSKPTALAMIDQLLATEADAEVRAAALKAKNKISLSH